MSGLHGINIYNTFDIRLSVYAGFKKDHMTVNRTKHYWEFTPYYPSHLANHSREQVLPLDMLGLVEKGTPRIANLLAG